MTQRLTIAELLANFESLGNNCEFGMVQGAAGYGAPGLFRNVGFLRTESIVQVIATSLAGMFDEGMYEFSRPDRWPDYALNCKVCGFTFHTGIDIAATDRPDFQKCAQSFRFLKRKFLEDLQEARKIFVYRHSNPTETSDDLARQLLAALRLHGPNRLLFVRQDPRPERRFAWAEPADEGLILAGIATLMPPNVDFAAWEKITRLALEFETGTDWRPRKTFKAVSSHELLEMPSIARIADRVADIDLELAPIAFGQTSRPDFAVTEYPDRGWENTRIVARDLRTIEIDDAVIHGEQGLVTVGDYLLKETLRLVSNDDFRIRWEEAGKVSLEFAEPVATVGLGSYLFCGYPGNRNYAHWLVDVLPAAFSPFVDQYSTLIWPKIRHDWQQATLSLLNENHRSMFLEDRAPVRCAKLRISPLGLIDSGHFPHPDRMALIEAMKARVGFDPERRRRLYVSRKDAGGRPLLNEDAVMDYLDAQGFEILRLTGMPVEQQIRCFAEAACVVGPHGAGLANVVFCPPGAAFCELFMDNYVQWSMRRLASVVPLRYGCAIGREAGFTPDHYMKQWTIDLAAVVHAVRGALAAN